MSLVGPRPLMMQYLPRYSPEQARRHDVPPGLTGAAQVEGRNSLSWPERFALDVRYVDHGSLLEDARILARTIGRVLSRRGVDAPDGGIMPEFMGGAADEDPAANAGNGLRVSGSACAAHARGRGARERTSPAARAGGKRGETDGPDDRRL